MKKNSTGAIAWMANNSVAANLLMAFFIIGGLIMYNNVTKEFFPDTQLDMVQVRVVYPGASPEEVEQGIILSVEEAIRGLEGVEEVTASANEGIGVVTAEIIEGEDASKIYMDIDSEIARITTFPEDAEEPEVSLLEHKREVLDLIVYGPSTSTALRELGEQIRDYLLGSNAITQVDMIGVRDLEIAISISQEKLRQYGLTIQNVADILRAKSIEVPGGGIDADSGEILVRMKERRDYGFEFAKTPIITTEDGSVVYLRDIATIEDGLEDSDRYALYDGMPSLILEVFRVGKQTPKEISDKVTELMSSLKEELPAGIKTTIVNNKSDIYDQRIDLMLRNGITGLLLVLFLLGTFLELRLAFWVMMGIPISFLGAFLLMPLFGVSLNMVTTFAFILALGIVVDDAIVVGENVYHHQKKLGYLEAAIVGAKEVASPVGFSILTNVAAFLPLMFLPGMMGKIMIMMPIIVITAFIISWVECVFILPAHLGHFKGKPKRGINRWFHHQQQRFSNWFIRQVQTKYGPFIDAVLHWRYIVAVGALVIFVITVGYIAGGHMGFETFPKVESDFAYVYAEMPYGTPIEKTEEVYKKVEAAAHKVIADIGSDKLSKGIFSDIGKSGSHTFDAKFYLADADVRDEIGISTNEVSQRWREATGEIPGIEYIQFQSDRGGPGSGDALTLEIKHKSLKVLEKASAEIAAKLKEFPIVADINDGFQPGKRQIDFRVLPEGESLGLTASYIARQVRNFYEGAEVVRQQRGRNEIKIKVRLPKSERKSVYDLQEMIILTPDKVEIPLKDVVSWDYGRAYTKISRRDAKRTVKVTADVKPRTRANEVINSLDAEIMPEVMRNNPGLTYSYQGRQADDRESIGSLAVMLPLVLVLIYALLAIPFRSYVQPLIVMTSIPLGVVGAVIGFKVMGYSLTIFGMIGTLALSGVVVNDALVLIDFANRSHAEGKSAHDSVVAAGIQRFRPILLTTLTTFGGLMPMIFETSRQARFIIPMAVALGFGILFATLITLLLVPCLYMISDDFRRFWRWLWAH